MIKPFPKPLPKPQPETPKPLRLPRRNAVTVVGGFKYKGGVVLCADTQETIEHTKVKTPKLRFEPSDAEGYDGPDELAAAFAGSGEGPFIDKLVERTWEDMQLGTTFDEVCQEAEKSIKLTYKEYGQIFQRGYCPHVELVYGIKMQGKSKLFKADGPIVNEKKDYALGGIGTYLSSFLTTRMYSPNLTLMQGVILASYVLFQAIEHLEGCGGDQHVAILNEGGGSEIVDPITHAGILNNLKAIDEETARTLLQVANLEFSNERVDSWIEHVRLLLLSAREKHQKEIEGWTEIKKMVADKEKKKRQEKLSG